MKRFWYFTLGPVALLLLGGGLVLLRGATVGTRAARVTLQTTGTPSMGTLSASPSLITVGTATPVLFTVQITDIRLIPDSVNLLRVNPNGTATTLGTMRDSGTNADEKAGDKIFSLRLNLTEANAGNIRFQASGAFRGVLRRIVSSPMDVRAWHVTTSSQGVRLNYPPDLVPVTPPNSTTLLLQPSSKPFLPSGGRLPEGLLVTDIDSVGYSISLSTLPYVTPFVLSQILSKYKPYSLIDTQSTRIVSGQPAYVVTFKDELFAGSPYVIIPKLGTTFIFQYRSSFMPGSPEWQSGLESFWQVLDSTILP